MFYIFIIISTFKYIIFVPILLFIILISFFPLSFKISFYSFLITIIFLLVTEINEQKIFDLFLLFFYFTFNIIF